MEVSKQQYVSVQLSYEETREALEQYVRYNIRYLPTGDLIGYKVEDYDPDCSRSSAVKNDNGAFFLFLKEE